MKKRILIVALLIVALLATTGLASAGHLARNYRAHLKEVVDANKNPQGQAIFKFNKAGDALHYKLIVANIDNVLMAHIHMANDSECAGPVVVWLYPEDGPPPSLIPGDFDGVLAQGTITAGDLAGPLTGASLGDLHQAMEDGDTFVMVHTQENVPGEICGFIH